MGDFLLHFPTLMKYLSFAVLYYEGLGVLLFFSPFFTQQLRTLGSILFMLMHIGFGSCMGLGIFSPVSCTTLATFLTPWFWDEVVFRWLYSGADRTIRILYYKSTPGEPISTFLSEFLLLPDTFIVTKADSELVAEKFNWMAVERNGVIYTNYEAFEKVCEVSPLLWPMRVFNKLVTRLPSDRTAVQSIFSLFFYPVSYIYYSNAQNQNRPMKPSESEGRAFRKLRKLVVNLLAIFFICYCISWNCGNLGVTSLSPLPSTLWIPFLTRIDQQWNMFSPGPPKMNWWYTIEGLLDDESRVEIWRDGLLKWQPTVAPFSVSKPESLGKVIGNHRWVKYYEYLNWGENVDIVRLNFGRYICREYNSRHAGKTRLWKFNLIFHREENMLNGPAVQLNDAVFWAHVCYEK